MRYLLETLVLRIFRSLLFRSKFADKTMELESRLELLEIWDFDFDLMSKEYGKILKYLQLYKVNGIQLKRIGSKNDGGYLLVDLFDEIDFVVSLGVGNNSDAELFFANLSKKCYLYDGSIRKLPRSHSNFKFEPVNVFGKSIDSDLGVKWVGINEILSKLMGEDGANQSSQVENNVNAILMMDIEGSEYDVVLGLKDDYLTRFQQVSIEFHNVHKEIRGKQKRLEKCLRKLGKTHVLINAHGNNFGGFLKYSDQDYPDVIELTWLNKTSGTFSKVSNSFTNTLNSPNNSRKRDLSLNWGM